MQERTLIVTSLSELRVIYANEWGGDRDVHPIPPAVRKHFLTNWFGNEAVRRLGLEPLHPVAIVKIRDDEWIKEHGGWYVFVKCAVETNEGLVTIDEIKLSEAGKLMPKDEIYSRARQVREQTRVELESGVRGPVYHAEDWSGGTRERTRTIHQIDPHKCPVKQAMF